MSMQRREGNTSSPWSQEPGNSDTEVPGLVPLLLFKQTPYSCQQEARTECAEL